MNFEAIDFGYSLKNIPIPRNESYKKSLMEKIESVLRRMLWKAHFYEKDNCIKENYGFKSRLAPPQNELIRPFEDDIFTLFRKIQFKVVKNPFLSKLNTDVKTIKKSNKVLVFADKTTNIYKVEKEDYKKIMADNVTKDYKKADGRIIDDINSEAAMIACRLDIDTKAECYTKRPAFITFKDHKRNFPNNLKCRLINPSKSNLGKVSKQMLEKINKSVRDLTGNLQWRNTASVIEWFKSIKNKNKCKFIKFDISEFYPSITKDILLDSLRYAKSITEIKDEDVDVIMHARKSLLFDSNEDWIRKKKNGEAELFDVTMGSWDGAEVCELVGLYILSKLVVRFGKNNIGLYRDDGLGIIPNASGPEADRGRKDLIKIFKMIGLKIDDSVETNIKKVDFLDVNFDLNKDIYYPYRKPNDKPLYINKSSNHPQPIIKQLPFMISRRVADLSCNQDMFNKSVPLYQEALEKSGYSHKLEYKVFKKKKRCRRRNIIWFNPPFSQSVKTNVGKVFLKLIDKHFPPGHKFHKLFNRSTIKVSYSCMNNMETIIKGHNARILNSRKDDDRLCNCRRKDSCPLAGDCNKKCVVYKASVNSEDVSKVYYGSCEGEFKVRYRNHIKSFPKEGTTDNSRYMKSTKLAEYIWELSEQNKQFEIAWEIVAKCQPYKSGDRHCDLCLTEKLFIAEANCESLLNTRSKILGKCRHFNKFSLHKFIC